MSLKCYEKNRNIPTIFDLGVSYDALRVFRSYTVVFIIQSHFKTFLKWRTKTWHLN